MKKIVYTLAIAACLASCSDEASENQDASTGGTVESFTATVESSRAMSSRFAQDDQISVMAFDRGVVYSAVANYACGADGETFSAVGAPISYTTAGQELSYMAIYPAQSGLTTLLEPFTFTGKSDQSSEANFRASDMLVGEGAVTVATDAAELLFEHVFSYVEFKVSGTGLSSATLTFTASVTAECDVALGLYSSSGSATTVKAYTLSSGDTEAIFGVVLPPQLLYDDFVTLSVGSSIYKYGKESLGSVVRTLESGSKYTFDISLGDMTLQ